METGNRGWNKKTKIKRLFNSFFTAFLKYSNELKAHKKNLRTVIEQDLNPNLNPFENAIWGVLENKTNAASYPNIGLLKTAIDWLVGWILWYIHLCRLFNVKSIFML